MFTVSFSRRTLLHGVSKLYFGFHIPFEILTAVLQGRDFLEVVTIDRRFILKSKLKK
jgi:hypothetical protein